MKPIHVLKYPNMTMQAKIEKVGSENQVETLFTSIQLCIDYIYDNETMYSNKDHTEDELREFIEALTDVQFKKLSEFFETMPKLQHKINLVCNNSIKDGKKKKTNCNYEEEITLDGLSSFFD